MAESKKESAGAVADAHNYEQRIKTENEAAMIWSHNWGSLYAAGEPIEYGDRIEKLEKEMNAIPTFSLATNSMISFTEPVPFDEPKWQNYGKKTFGKFENFGDFKEKLDPRYKPNLK